MADICRDWLTDLSTDYCFVAISHPTIPQPFALQLI